MNEKLKKLNLHTAHYATKNDMLLTTEYLKMLRKSENQRTSIILSGAG